MKIETQGVKRSRITQGWKGKGERGRWRQTNLGGRMMWRASAPPRRGILKKEEGIKKEDKEIVTKRTTLAHANMLCFRVLVARFLHGKIDNWGSPPVVAKQIFAQRT